MSEFDDNEDYQEDIEQVEDDEVIDDEQDIDEDSQDDEQDGDESDDSTDDDVLEFSFDDDGEESDPFKGQEAPEWVKQVRKENRELKRQLKQRESQQTERQQALREKPTFEGSEFDEDVYQADLDKWYAEKAQHDAKVQVEQQKYKQYDERYQNDANALKAKAPDYDEIEQSIADIMPESKQALLKMAVENPAKMVYALGKSPKQLESLIGLDDVQFVKQIALLEHQMTSKAKSRNPNKPKPKTHELEGAAGGTDTKLAKLEAEAAKTGDRSKVIAYKRNK